MGQVAATPWLPGCRGAARLGTRPERRRHQTVTRGEGCEDGGVDDADVHYAQGRDGQIAFTVVPGGDRTIVLVTSMSNQDIESSVVGREFRRRLRSLATVVAYDQRGSGLSDPITLNDFPTLESRTDDLQTIIEAVGAEEVVLAADAFGGATALLYAATHPQRVRALVLQGAFAALAWSPDYPVGWRPEEFERFIRFVERSWGTGRFQATVSAQVDIDDGERRRLAREERMAMTPAVAAAVFRQQYRTDVRALLPTVSAPTLVLHNDANPFLPIGFGRYLAEHIPDARFVEVPGTGLGVTATTQPVINDEIEVFLTGTLASVAHDRQLATLLLIDIVGSTPHVAEQGDHTWRRVLDQFEAAIDRQLQRFSGQQRKLTGDGVLASFDAPARAIRCGVGIRDVARQMDLDVRVGIHTGEIEVRGSEIAGSPSISPSG